MSSRRRANGKIESMNKISSNAGLKAGVERKHKENLCNQLRRIVQMQIVEKKVIRYGICQFKIEICVVQKHTINCLLIDPTTHPDFLMTVTSLQTHFRVQRKTKSY